MDVVETEVVSINDVSFGGRPMDADLLTAFQRLPSGAPTELPTLYNSSYDWVLYRDHEGMPTPPGTKRFFFAAAGEGTFPGSILIHAASGVAVISQWSGAFAGLDPLTLKLGSTPEDWPDGKRLLVREGTNTLLARLRLLPSSTNPYRVGVEREYPFFAVTIPVSAGEIASYCRQNAEHVGRLFTGGLEHEEPTKLREYVDSNISWRDYERIYMRWGEALALYSSSGIEPGVKRLSFTRAVQIYELCIMVRRIMVDAIEEISALSTGLTVFSPPVVGKSTRRANAALTKFTSTELQYVVAPPVQSVEGDWLYRQAMRSFGVPDVIEATRRNYEALDRRTQWMKGQWLAAVALLTFIANLVVSLVK